VAMVGDGINDAPVGIHAYPFQSTTLTNSSSGVDCGRRWDRYWLRQ
jgi:hypothetical protein